MSARRNVTSTRPRRAALMVALLLAWPLAPAAQTAPAASASSGASAGMGGMDMGAMPGMPMPAASASGAAPAAAAPARKKPRRKPASPPSKDREGMKGMHRGHMPMPMPARPAAAAPASGSMQDMSNMSGMDHGAMPATAQPPAAAGPHDMQRMSDMSGMDHSKAKAQPDAGMAGMAAMSMGAMQGGNAPANARSPDYSDGVGYGPMKGMDMADNAPLGMLLIDQLEAFHGYNGNGQAWEAAGWYGNDSNKLWLRSAGDSRRGKVESGDVEAFWNHNIATYWRSQLGVRQDLGVGPGRSWAAFGVEGLAPYWFKLEATGYVGSFSRTAARFRANYDLLFTQRLILQPEFEVNLYGKSDPARGIGGGLSDARLGLRLRYEIRRQFAPYIGVVWTRRFGATASFARHDRQAIFDRQWVAGVRIWF
jgi:copper resistance protein B